MSSPLNDAAARRAPERELASNRKLIRPSLAEIREQLASRSAPLPPVGPPANATAPVRAPKKPVPPEQTNAESFYYLKQMQTKTAMVLVLQDGERIQGVIEWYDRHCLKLHREGVPNLLIYKANIKYIFKAEDEHREE